jgi:hypothetical protein
MAMGLTKNVYVGNRYVPKLNKIWDINKVYGSLEIVPYQGNSYTSVTNVPSGVDILNENYWICTGNYNLQVEQYRQETRNSVIEITNKFNDFVDTQEDKFTLIMNKTKTDIETYLDEEFAKVDNKVNGVTQGLTTLEFNMTNLYNDSKADVETYVNSKYQEINNERLQIENLINEVDWVIDGGDFIDNPSANIMDGGTW